MRFKPIKLPNFRRFHRAWKGTFFDGRWNPLMLSLPRGLVLQIVWMRIPRTLSILRIFFCIFNEAKCSTFVSCKFLEDFKFYETRNNILESSSLKEFFEQSFRISDFSNLSSHSRYSQSATLNMWVHNRSQSITNSEVNSDWERVTKCKKVVYPRFWEICYLLLEYNKIWIALKLCSS